MFTNQDIVAIVFKLINFIALIGVGFFLFKKYILPDLLASIIRKKENHNALCAQQTTLEKQQLHLDALLKEDSLLCAEFRSKIDEWKKVVTLESESYEKEHNKALIASNERTATIASLREHNRVQKIVTHAIVTDLQKSLTLHFEDQQKSTDYLNSIFHFMDERI